MMSGRLVMPFRISAIASLLLGAAIAGIPTAAARCHNRPGAPDHVSVDTVSSTFIQWSWRNATGKKILEPRMWFDMYIRGGGNRNINRDMTGTGPFSVQYNERTVNVVQGLAPHTTYCFSLRARSEGGTQGCISRGISNVSCATTLAVGSVPNPPVPVPGAAAINIAATGKPGNTIIIGGSGFLPNAPVGIRVADQSLAFILIVTIAGQPIRSSPYGTISVTLTGLCHAPGPLTFSAEDGRHVPASVDVTGNLWSNTATINCT